MRTFIVTGLLLAAAASPAAAVNLITNGDFSAGTAGWTTTNGTHYTDATGFHEGAVGVTDLLSQTFADTAGTVLTVNFDFSSDSGFQYVQFNGNTVAGSYIGAPTPYTHYTFTLGTATGSDSVTFAGRNDPSYNTLDNVAVTASVPEPAAWALMIVGFGLVGAAARRRGLALAA